MFELSGYRRPFCHRKRCLSQCATASPQESSFEGRSASSRKEERSHRQRFLEIRYRIWKNLPTEMHDLSRISRIFEQNQVVSMETNISLLFAFVEQILNYVNHAAVEMMRSLCENFCYSRISFGHEVVYDVKHSLFATVQNVHIGHTFDKFDTVDVSE